MEGCPTSVIETLVLPAQPTVGAVQRIPLGGDGFTAPIAAYSVVNFTLTGDAGGGVLRARVDMDARFCSLISYVTFDVQQATPAAEEFRQFISAARAVPLMVDVGSVANLGTFTTFEINHMWQPPPLILPGADHGAYHQLSIVNTDTDVLRVNLYIYIFDIRVRELTPMGPLLWARGAT